MTETIALIAHDQKKAKMLALVQKHQAVFASYHLIATGTTGKLIEDQTGLAVEKMLSGPLGGDLQIGARIVTGEILAVFFLVDPLYAQPHEPDINALLRMCEIYNVPIALNLATAEAIIPILSQSI